MTTTRAGAGRRAEQRARSAKDREALTWSARLGFACYGLVYLLVGWLALQLTFGRPSRPVSGSGAMSELAQQPAGRVLVWLVAAGLAALVVWEVCQAVGGHREQEGLRRLGGRALSAGRGVVFAALTVAAVRTEVGGHGTSSGQQGQTARLLATSWGPVVVALVGVCLVGFGLGSIYGGFADTWRKQVDAQGQVGTPGTVVTWVARVGYVARGLAFGIMGGFVVWAAFTRDAQHSRGLDQALASVRDAPAGTALLLAVAVGLACYGAFNAAKAVFLRES